MSSRCFRARCGDSGETLISRRFLLGIAVKRVRHHRRAALRRRKALERLRAVERRGLADPEQDTYRRQLGARLAAALDELPLPQRVAFVLCEVEELTSVQAAVYR